jgi:hypothetical protein
VSAALRATGEPWPLNRRSCLGEGVTTSAYYSGSRHGRWHGDTHGRVRQREWAGGVVGAARPMRPRRVEQGDRAGMAVRCRAVPLRTDQQHGRRATSAQLTHSGAPSAKQFRLSLF